MNLGCKWSLKQLRHYFHQAQILDWLLWQRVAALVVLTVVSQLSGIPNTANCFEFYGFDVLIDSNLRPWLLEVCKLYNVMFMHITMLVMLIHISFSFNIVL